MQQRSDRGRHVLRPIKRQKRGDRHDSCWRAVCDTIYCPLETLAAAGYMLVWQSTPTQYWSMISCSSCKHIRVRWQQGLLGVVVLTAVNLFQPSKLISKRPSRSEAAPCSVRLYSIFMLFTYSVNKVLNSMHSYWLSWTLLLTLFKNSSVIWIFKF